MGRWSYSNKEEADGLKKVEIWWLKKYGYLSGWKYGGIEWKNSWSDTKSSISITGSTMDGDNYIRFYYTQTDCNGEKKEFDYKVYLITTPCHYGGKRYWFECPCYKNGVYCGRRVGVLYKNGDYFACRHCYNLTYSSQKANRKCKNYHLFYLLETSQKIDKLQDKIKRNYYAGKPTRKLKRLMNIYQRTKPYTALLEKKHMI